MSDILVRIKRAVLAGNYVFSEKAWLEMEADSLTELDVAESILSSVAVSKLFVLPVSVEIGRTSASM